MKTIMSMSIREFCGKAASFSLALFCAGDVFGATITAVDTSAATVQNAINSAANGDTVVVPAGSATWSSTVTVNKGIRLVGAGAGKTVITQGGSTMMLNISGNGQYLQVSGFTFHDAGVNYGGYIQASGNGWRICSNEVYFVGEGIAVRDTDVASGLIDNNIGIGSGGGFAVLWGSSSSSWNGTKGNDAWAYGTTYGTTNYLYIEHNRITMSSIGDGVIDAYGGAKFVFRYNIMTNCYVGWHGADSGYYRSPHSWEIYGNQFYYNNGGYYAVVQGRGGTGLIFSNSIVNRTSKPDGAGAITLNNYRAPGADCVCQQAGTCSPWNWMTGSNPYDGNTDSTGYPGLDQFGMTGPTTGYATTGSGTSTTQVHSPVYIWANTGNWGIAADPYIVSGRDYYTGTALNGYTPLVDPHPLAGGTSAPNTTPPSIITQPQNATVVVGSPATFSAVATGGGTLAYQWAWYGTNVTGATATSWTTPATVLGNSNSVVSVRVASAYGGVTSANAYLYVMNGVAPTITTQPSSRTSGTGGLTTFAVTAIGTAPLAYQWRFNSSPISGATASSYTIGSVATNSAGSYSVVVTNSFGSVASAVAVLTVTVSTQAVHYYYVATTGSDSAGDGSIGRPWATLGHATSLMNGGDTLYVRGGTYNSGSWDLYGPSGSNANNQTVIVNYPGEHPVFSGYGISGGACSLNGLQWLTVSGLTLTNYQIAIAVGYYGGVSNVTLTNLTACYIGNEGLQIYHNSHDVLLVNSTIHDTGLYTQNGEGVYVGQGDSAGILDNSHNIIIRGNTIYNTKDEAIEIKPGTYSCTVEGNTVYTSNKAQDSFGAGGGAIEIDEEGTYNNYPSNPAHMIRGNLVYDTVIGIRLGTGSTCYNNVVFGCTQNGILINNNNGDSYYRYVYNNTVPMTASTTIVRTAGNYVLLNNLGPSGNYNLVSNASYFGNASGNDYHLVAGSAPIGAGTNLFSVVATDFDGKARPSGGAFDIGAYQYTAAGANASPPPPPTNLHVAGQ